MTKLILHVGPHKTGTSAIQVALEINNGLLMEHGWKYETFPSFQGGASRIADRIHAFGAYEEVAEILSKRDKNFDMT